MAQKILVVGATGLVGNALARAWGKRGATVVATYHVQQTSPFLPLDMRDARAVEKLLKDVRPDWVALPAANPNVDYCELHPEETRRVNVEGSLNVLRATSAIGARLIFFSSYYVFDGAKEVYSETDGVSPLNEYGRQKVAVETAVLNGGGHLVIRTSGAYGWQLQPKNFALQIRAKLAARQPVKVAEGVRYNPTYAENLAEIVCELSHGGAGGLYHVVGADRVRRFEFALAVARAFGLEESLIESVPDAQFKPPALRPRESSLSTDKLKAVIRMPLWGIESSLRHMVESTPNYSSPRMK